MMRKVVDHGDARLLAAHLGAAAHVFERLECCGDGLSLNPPGISGDDHGERIEHVEIADQRYLKLTPFFAFAKNLESHQRTTVIDITGLPGGAVRDTERLQLRE